MSQRPAGIPDSWQSRPCAACGATIWRPAWRFTALVSYCDRTCKAAGQERTDLVRATLTCVRCGVAFERVLDGPAPKQPHCSLECRYPEYANVRKPRTQAPPWPVVKLPEDDPRQRIRARFRAVREKWEATA